MLDRFLNTPLPGEEKKYIRGAWITAVVRSVLPKFLYAFSNLRFRKCFVLPLLKFRMLFGVSL